MDLFVSCNMGQKKYRDMSSEVVLSKVTTAEDEAHALVQLDNHWNVWEDEFMNKSPRRKAKYTRPNVSHQKHKGWSAEGFVQYNKFFDMVKTDRTSDEGQMVEEELLKGKKKEQEKNWGKRKRRKIGPSEETEYESPAPKWEHFCASDTNSDTLIETPMPPLPRNLEDGIEENNFDFD